MKTGVIDVGWLNFVQVYDYKLWEIAKYFLDSDLGGQTAMVICMNWDSWNKLSPENQKLLEELTPVGRLGCAEGSIKVAEDGMKGIKDAGKTIYTINPDERAKWQAITEPLWHKWVDDMEANGIDGQAMMDYWLELRNAYVK
jgi:TRAP-type C4-dicarboxylate transport system substrate-binding protein